MAYTRTLYGRKYGKYNYCEFVCDSTADLPSLPTKDAAGSSGANVYNPCCPGSKSFVISGSRSYILNNSGEWISIAIPTSGEQQEAGITEGLVAIPASDTTLKDLLAAFPIEFPYSTGLCFVSVVGNRTPTVGSNTLLRAVFHIRNGSPYEMLYRTQSGSVANPESNPSLPLTYSNGNYFDLSNGYIKSNSLTNNAAYIAAGNRVNYTCVQVDIAG